MAEDELKDLNARDIKDIEDIKVDLTRLYREETFTDLDIASLRRLVPIKPDGSIDEGRTPIFIAQTHILTKAGPLPIQASVEANNLQEAFENLPETIKKAVEQMMERLKEMKGKEEPRIIVPKKGQDA